MYKLFVYDNISMPSHDNVDVYQNVIPFCKKGIADNFEITNIGWLIIAYGNNETNEPFTVQETTKWQRRDLNP